MPTPPPFQLTHKGAAVDKAVSTGLLVELNATGVAAQQSAPILFVGVPEGAALQLTNGAMFHTATGFAAGLSYAAWFVNTAELSTIPVWLLGLDGV